MLVSKHRAHHKTENLTLDSDVLSKGKYKTNFISGVVITYIGSRFYYLSLKYCMFGDKHLEIVPVSVSKFWRSSDLMFFFRI